MGRTITRTALGLLASTILVGCTPKPTPSPDRPREARRQAPPPREAARLTPAPTGPDISAELLVTARFGAMHQLDRRLAALAPSIVPPAFTQGLFSRRLLPELARDVGLNALALDALDLTRPLVIGLLVKKHANPRQMAHVRPVALIPLRGDPKLVKDAIKVSWPDSTEAPWGGVAIRADGRTKAWVHAEGSWAVVAPTGPLCDSARRALAPLAKDIDEGAVRLNLRFASLVEIFRDGVAKAWEQVKALEAMARRGGGITVLTSLLLHAVPLAERLAPYVASIGELELSGRVADDAWSWDLRLAPSPGGKLASWVAGLQPAKGFGTDLLPTGAAVVTVDRRGEELRLFGAKLLGRVIEWVVGSVTSRDLPEAVKQRGLLDRARPATLLQYRQALRDLNLADYQASYHVYQLLFALKAIRRHLETHAPRLVALGTGETAAALYPAGGRLGAAMVEGVKDPAAHRRAALAQVVGLQRLANQLLGALWQLLPKKDRQELNLTTNPLQVVWNPMALRVGRFTASSLSVRIRWPRRPPMPKGRPDAARAIRRAFAQLDQVKAALEHLFGKGDPTYAWAYVGNRVVTTAGHDWQARMKAMLGRAAGSAKGPGVLSEPVMQNALRGAAGEPLSVTVGSGARILVAALEAFRALAPKIMAQMPGPLAMFLRQLEGDARASQTATRMIETRQGGAWVLSGRIPAEDLKGALMGAGMLFFTTMRASAPSHRPPVAVPPSPPTPYQP